MKLCIGGNPPAHPKGRAQGLALGWGHSGTAWDISRASAGLLQGEHEEREQPLFLFVCLGFVTSYVLHNEAPAFPAPEKLRGFLLGSL